METAPSADILVVAYASGRVIIGTASLPKSARADLSWHEKKELIIQATALQIQEPVEVMTQHMSRPGPGGMEIVKQVVPMPLGEALYPCEIWVKPEMIMFIDDLQRSDQERYKKLVEDAKLHAQGMRAKSAGIEIVSSLQS